MYPMSEYQLLEILENEPLMSSNGPRHNNLLGANIITLNTVSGYKILIGVPVILNRWSLLVFDILFLISLYTLLDIIFLINIFTSVVKCALLVCPNFLLTGFHI